MYEYIYLILIFFILLCFAYIKIKYPFWNMQPVYHTYDIWRGWTKNPFIIWSGYPMRTKYTTPKKVTTAPFSEISEIQKDKIIDLLQCYSIESERVLNIIDKTTLTSYMTGHSEPSYVSFYMEDHLDLVIGQPNILGQPNNLEQPNLGQPSLEIQNKPVAIGTMLSRPIRIFIWNIDKMTDWRAYYWDWICVHRDYRNKNLSRNIIQSHEYYQRIENPNVQASLFKKDEILCQGIVPLVEYKTFTFYLRDVKIPPLPPHCTVVRIFQENVGILSDFLYGISHPAYYQETKTPDSLFSICAFPEVAALTVLLKQNIWYIYALKRGDDILGLYFLKDAKTTYEDVEGGNLLECVSSVCNMTMSKTGTFFAGFLHAIRDIMNLKNTIYRMIGFTDLAHNGRILEKWRWKYTPIFENRSAYYLYNMVVPGMPIAKERCLVLL